MPKDFQFEHCNVEQVFAEVGKQVQSSEVRTLWGCMQEEMERRGVGAAVTYLEGEFTRLNEELTREIQRIKDHKC